MEKVEKVKKPRKPISKKIKIIILAALALLLAGGLVFLLIMLNSCGNGHRWGEFKVAQKPTCAVVGKKVHTCKVCRKSEAEDIETLEHTYKSVWKSGETRHWYECEECGGKCEADYHNWGKWEVVEEPTCTETGIKKRICKDCDKEDTFKIAKLGHIAGELWSSNAKKHFHICTVCGEKVQIAAHAYDKWTKVKDATVNADGAEASTCKECGYRGTRTIEKTGAKSVVIKGGKSVTVGGTLQLTATVQPAEVADKSVTWSSAKNDIATVNANGTVTGLKAGSTRIIATAANGKRVSTVVWVTETAIDGNLSDGIYQSLTPFVWNQTDVNVGENIRLYFGADGLYIADHVSDAKVKQNGDKSHIEAFLTLSNVFKGVDSIGIRFYPNGYSETGAVYRTYVYDYKGANENYHWSERKDAVILEMDAAVQYTSNGYNVEAFIPWGTLGLTKAPSSMHYMSVMQAVFEGTSAKMRYGTYVEDVAAYKQVHAYDAANYIKYDKKGFVHKEVCTDKEEILLGNNHLVNQKYTTEFKLNKMNDLNLLTGATFKGTGAEYISEVGNGVYKIAVPREKVADFATPQTITIVDGRNIGKTFTLQLIDAFLVDDLAVTFNEKAEDVVLYGAGTKVDMRLFEATTATTGLTYNWTLTYNGEAVTGLDMTSKAYAFANAGTYVLTAEIATPGYLGSASMEIHVMNPDVYVSYDKGTVANTGTNTSIKAGTYVMDHKGGNDGASTRFVGTTSATYTTGRSDDAKGAMVTNHYKGAYTIVKNYPFGTNNFTISSWFMIPTGAEVAQGSGTMLLGNDHPDTKTGFAVNLKKNDKGETELRVRVANSSKFIPVSYENDKWYNLTVQREGSAFKVYLNGVLLGTYDIDTSCDYGTKDLAFGAYYGVSWAYKDANTYYDDIQIYSSVLTADQIQTMANSEGVPMVETALNPKVRVNYTGGAVTNSGTDTGIVVGTYVMDSLKNATKFETTSNVSYTNGRGYDANGAIITNHYKGAYTVVKDYVFGTNDFTISTWFKVPTGSEAASGAGTMLLGNDHPDTSTGFAISLKPAELRVKVAGKTQTGIAISYNKNTWYNLTVSREGSMFKVYLDGNLKGTYDIGADCNYGTRDIAFGAYHGVSWAYKDATTYFDDIEVYDQALTIEQLRELINSSDDTAPIPKVFIDYTGGVIVNGGSNKSLTLGAYLMDALKNATKFEQTSNVSYTIGRGDETKGAIITNHYKGPYTVVKDYPLGTSDFTISTWFKVPTGSEAASGAGTMLLGNDHPDTGTGFAISLKPAELRVKVAGKTQTGIAISYSKDTWYNLTVSREGSLFKVYLDGNLKGTYDIGADCNYGTRDIAFGAYHGVTWAYKDANTYFDDIAVYAEGLSREQIDTLIIGK